MARRESIPKRFAIRSIPRRCLSDRSSACCATMPRYVAEAMYMVLDHEKGYSSRWAAISSVAEKIGCTTESLPRWVQRGEIDEGTKHSVNSVEKDRIKQLEREDTEPRRNKRGSVHLAMNTALFAADWTCLPVGDVVSPPSRPPP